MPVLPDLAMKVMIQVSSVEAKRKMTRQSSSSNFRRNFTKNQAKLMTQMKTKTSNHQLEKSLNLPQVLH